MAFCTNCGSQVNDGASFCPNCGSPVQAAPTQTQQPAQQGYQQAPQQQYQQPAQQYQQPAQQAYQQPQQQYQQYQQPYQQPAQQQYQQPYHPYRQQPAQYAGAGAAKPEYQKLGGWLLVLVVLEAISILSYFSMLFQSIEAIGSLSSAGGTYLLIGVLSLAANVLGLVYAIGFVVFVVKRNPIFLWFYQVLGLASMALALINIVISTTMIAGGGYASVAAGSGIAGVVVGILFLVLFTMYFCKSQRVRTYMGSTEYIDRALFKIGA